jgi:O-antigen/teichoic acid export membrane protein
MLDKPPTPSPPGAQQHDGGNFTGGRRLMSRIVGYGMSRTGVEALFAGRGLLLAGILGPEIFGVWALFRIGLRYLAFAGLGLLRGLEFEVSRSSHLPQHSAAEQTLWGRITAGHTLLLYGVLSALAAMAWAASSERVASVALLGIAIALLFDRLWSYGITFLRVSGGLRRFAILEILHAGMQVVLCVLFALWWGLPGAFAGFAIANLMGVALLAGRAPLKPSIDFRRVRRLIQVGFPVSLTGILSAALVTVDRMLVGAIIGLSGLGLYAFAVSISELGVSFAAVVRTVILKDVYGQREPSAEGGGHLVLGDALTAYAILGPPLAGIFALLLPLLVAVLAEDYSTAVPAAQILLFAGLIQGLSNVGVLGIVADGRQSRLPVLSIAAVCLNVILTVGALSVGLGLEGVALAALLTRLTHAAAIVILLKHDAAFSALVAEMLRLLAPSIWCAFAVYMISHQLPAGQLKALIFQLLLYAVAVSVMSPLIFRVLALRRRNEESTLT